MYVLFLSNPPSGGVSFGRLWTGVDLRKRREAGSSGLPLELQALHERAPEAHQRGGQLANRDEVPVKHIVSPLVLLCM